MSTGIYQKPFLKWAGGKYKLLNHILPEISDSSGTFFEPFVGSGVVFLNIGNKYSKVIVGDSNPDLINLYTILKTDAASFISELKNEYFDGSQHNDTAYYSNRQTFNNTGNARLRAKLFVYLNRHCFNGLCRYNSKGEYNVPFGKYKTVYFPETELLEFHNRSQNVEFHISDFHTLVTQAAKGDVIYMDPPYVALTTTANFSDYSSDGGFDYSKQQQLASVASELQLKGAKVVISNHDTNVSRALYAKASRIIQLKAPRRISGNGNRDHAPELLAIYE